MGKDKRTDMTKPQSQESLNDQLAELVDIANREGLYDAADFITKFLPQESTYARAEPIRRGHAIP